MQRINENLYIILKKVFLFLPFLVLANVIFSFFTTDINSFHKLNSFSFYYFAVSILLGIAPWLTHSVKIYIWCRYLKYRVPYIETVRIAIGSDLGAAISPTAVGGSPVRAAMLIADGLKPSDSVFMSLIATIEDTLFLTFSFIALLLALDKTDIAALKFLNLKYINLSLLYYLAVIIPLIYVLYKSLFFRFKWINKTVFMLKNMTRDIRTAFKWVIKDGKKVFLTSFILNMLQWLVRYLVIFTLLLSLGVHVSFFETIILGWFVYFAILFIPTPGAVLGAEAAFFLIFQSMLSADLIGLVTFGWRFLTFYLQLTLGIILFLSAGYYTEKGRNL
jgi:glycosyltransferase 2 family protein